MFSLAAAGRRRDRKLNERRASCILLAVFASRVCGAPSGWPTAWPTPGTGVGWLVGPRSLSGPGGPVGPCAAREPCQAGEPIQRACRACRAQGGGRAPPGRMPLVARYQRRSDFSLKWPILHTKRRYCQKSHRRREPGRPVFCLAWRWLATGRQMGIITTRDKDWTRLMNSCIRSGQARFRPASDTFGGLEGLQAKRVTVAVGHFRQPAGRQPPPGPGHGIPRARPDAYQDRACRPIWMRAR